jgi:hypothetical protein
MNNPESGSVSIRQYLRNHQQRIPPKHQVSVAHPDSPLALGVQAVESADAVDIEATPDQRVGIKLVPEIAPGAQDNGIGEIPTGPVGDAGKDVTALRTLGAAADEAGIGVALADDFGKEFVQITDKTFTARGFGFLAHFRMLQGERSGDKA